MPLFPSALSTKLPKVSTTIFAVMSKLAQEHNAINLSQGFPNFNPPAGLIDLVNKQMKQGLNQYAPMPGIMPLREAIAEKSALLYNAKYNPETEITVTAGATQAIFTAITAVVKENDEVIIFGPAYDCYQPAIELTGGKTVYIPLTFPSYRVDWEQVKRVINHRTRMIIINTPHNPSGSIFTATDIEELQRITKDTQIIILSDEVYEHMVFDKNEHQSIAKYPALADRSFIISSFGKTYHNTGWKMGYCLAPENLMAEFRKVHQFIVFSVNTPIQYAYAEFLENKDAYLELNAFYQKKRDHFRSLVKHSKFNLLDCSGTYFQLLDYKNVSDEKDTEFAIRLTKEYGIASIPVSVFYSDHTDNKVLRFCFAKDDVTLEKAAEILNKIN